MRAMPSPTSSTRPDSRASTFTRYSLISVSRTETISPGLNLMIASLEQLVPYRFDARAQAGVVEPVLDAQHQAAEQFRVHAQVEHRLALEGGAQLLAEPFHLVLGQGRRRRHLDRQASEAAVVGQAVGPRDRAQVVQAVVLVEDQEEIDESF